MPTIGEFNERFAAIVEASHGGVLKVQRVLRDARMITTGARGINAPNLNMIDAARMLLAFVVTDRPSLAVAAVLEFGRLPVSMLQLFPSEGDLAQATFSKEMDGVSTVEDGIVRLISSYAMLSPEDREERGMSAKISCAASDMSVTLEWPGGIAIFSNSGSWMDALKLDDQDRRRKMNDLAATALRDSAAAGKYLDQNGARRVRTVRTISGEVLAKISEMFVYRYDDAE